MLEITTPTLLVDENKCRKNIRKMAQKLKESSIIFRPHYKTHQSLKIGNWYKDEGIKAITVSSVKMAYYFANAGWKDISISFPVNLLEIKEINYLSKLVNLEILISDPNIISSLSGLLDKQLNIWLEIDTGYHRSGISAENTDLISRIIKDINSIKKIKIKGFLSHTGNTYNASSTEEIKMLHKDAVNTLNKLRNRFIVSNPGLLISLGDTPSFSLLDEFHGLDEGRPGNFIFYDLMQYQFGACSIEDIAVALACPIVAKYPDRGQVVIYGGAVHFSKEFLINKNNHKSYGQVVTLNNTGWQYAGEENFLSGLSQEHGIINLGSKMMNSVEVGDLIGVLPVHSCLTASCMKGFLTLDGITLDHLEGLNK